MIPTKRVYLGRYVYKHFLKGLDFNVTYSEFPHFWLLFIEPNKATKCAVTCVVCPESGWLFTFLIGNVSTGVITWSELRCSGCVESGKNVAAAPLSKTATAAAADKTRFAKLPLDRMLRNRFPWKMCRRRSAMWPPYSLWRNLSTAACCPCDCSLISETIRRDRASPLLSQVMFIFPGGTKQLLKQCWLITIKVPRHSSQPSISKSRLSTDDLKYKSNLLGDQRL